MAAGKELKYFSDDEAVLERQGLMKLMNVGVENLGFEIDRIDKSASDDKIKIVSFHDLKGMMLGAPNLKRVLLTGYSSKTNSYNDFLRYLEIIGASFLRQPKKGAAFQRFKFSIEGREFSALVGNSTSPLTRVNTSQETLLEQFREVIFG